MEDLRENIMMALPHELRTPLNVILGFSDLLMTDCQMMEPERIEVMSRHINLSALRLYRLIENFLIYTHTEMLMTDHRQVEYLKNKLHGLSEDDARTQRDPESRGSGASRRSAVGCARCRSDWHRRRLYA